VAKPVFVDIQIVSNGGKVPRGSSFLWYLCCGKYFIFVTDVSV